MTRNLRPFERGVRVVLALMAFFLAAVIFTSPVVQIGLAFFGIYCLAEALLAVCPSLKSMGATTTKTPLSKEVVSMVALIGVQLLVAYEWGEAGIGKLTSPEFVEGMSKTVMAFGAKNPFGWYKNFLMDSVLEHSRLFAFAVEYGEAAVGLGLIVGVLAFVYGRSDRMKQFGRILSVVALVGGMFMSANFYFAAGWMSASTKGMNMVFFWMQACLLYYHLAVLSGSASSSKR